MLIALCFTCKINTDKRRPLHEILKGLFQQASIQYTIQSVIKIIRGRERNMFLVCKDSPLITRLLKIVATR